MNEVLRYKHNDRLENYGGHKVGRFMLPDPDHGRCFRQLIGTRDILNFQLQPGDSCPEDAYDKAKERAYLVFDADPRSSNRPAMTPLRMETALDMQKGPIITSWWFTFMQWNQWPGKDGKWRPPPFSLDLELIKGREFLVANVRHFDAAGAVVKQQVASMLFERRRYQVAVDFTCSDGQPGGVCRLTVDGRTIGEYRGPNGYPGGAVYAALGLYRATPRSNLDIQHVKFEGFREGAV